jgi:hypothetical protein
MTDAHTVTRFNISHCRFLLSPWKSIVVSFVVKFKARVVRKEHDELSLSLSGTLAFPPRAFNTDRKKLSSGRMPKRKSVELRAGKKLAEDERDVNMTLRGDDVRERNRRNMQLNTCTWLKDFPTRHSKMCRKSLLLFFPCRFTAKLSMWPHVSKGKVFPFPL